MQKLKEANLYNNDLISISGKLVERYNTCLIKLGFTPTKLTNFHIDGIGWSPEIAEEKDNNREEPSRGAKPVRDTPKPVREATKVASSDDKVVVEKGVENV